MRILRYFGVALESIQAHTLRAFLTMLGIIIGITAVLVTVGIGSGASASITDRIESNGTNQLTVSAGESGSNSASALTLADAEAFSDPERFPDLVFVVPQDASNATLTNGNSEGDYQVLGTTQDYSKVKNLDLSSGAFLSEDQISQNQNVIVLGANVASDLFGGRNALGQSMRVNDTIFQVIGLLESSGSSGFGSADDQAFVPISVALSRLSDGARYRGSYNISGITIQVVDETRLDSAELQVEQVLRLRHNLGEDDANDFSISNQADLLDMAGDISTTLSLLLGGIGAVSLIVGGIGIMNIMLVSVTERTREIGLRKALGAHDLDILLQFVVEALVLCTIGGLIGIGLSYGIAWLVSLVPGLPIGLVIEEWAVMLALIVSCASGLVFGFYPAWRATKLDPIEALRYE